MADADSESQTTHRERLYAAFEADRPLDDRIDDALTIGVDRFDVEQGFVSWIEDGTLSITHSVGPNPILQAGTSCPLDDAYCAETVERDTTLAVQQAADDDRIDPALHEHAGLETYLGAPIVVDGETIGTICFADRQPRSERFSEVDLVFVDLLARLLGNAFERRKHDRELARRNRELERERDRFRGIANSSFDIVFRLDADARFTFVSNSAERILGRPPGAVLGEPLSAVVSAEDVERASHEFAAVATGGSIEGLELALAAADGETVTVEVNALPIEEDGSVVAVQGVARDVTERAERERELQLKTRAMDETQVGINVSELTEDGLELIYVNEGFTRLTGYDLDSMAEVGWNSMSGPASDPAASERVIEAARAGEDITQELVSYRRDGTPYWDRVRITPIQDGCGELTHVAGFQEDITDGKRRTALFGVLNRVLRHNLRNQMTVLQGYAGRLRTDDEDPDEIATAIQTLVEDLTGVSERARELESYARSERIAERLPLDDLLERVVDHYATATSSVTIDRSTDLGICAGPEIERALGELIENAGAHDDDPPTSVTVGAIADDGDVVITVRDDGCGIPRTESAVFQVGRETPLEHSGGLGLWLVNWVVTRYGGSFQIDDRENGNGTVATVRLPGIGRDETVDDAARPPTPLFQ